MANLLGLDVKAKVDAVPNDPPELDYEVWLKAVYNAVEEWVGIQASVQSVSSNTTLTKDSLRTTKITTGATNKTITLPVGSTCREGQRFRIFKADSGAGYVSLARQSTDTIDGTTSPTLLYSQYNYVEVEWLGSGLWVITPGGLKSNGSNSYGEWNHRADGSGTITMWGFVTGDGVNQSEADINNQLPVDVSTVLSSVATVVGYKTSNPSNRWDITGTSWGYSIACGWDGTYLDVQVWIAADGFVVIGNGDRLIWTATLETRWRT